MEVIRYSDPAILWEKLRPRLLKQEAANNLIVGILKSISENKDQQSEDHLWFTVENGGDIELVGWRTPPFDFGLWSAKIETTQALECFLDFLEKEGLEKVGAVGKPALVESYIALAIPRFNLENTFTMNQGIYECRRVDPTLLGRGSIRLVTMDEIEKLTDWMIAFHIESLNQEPLRSEARNKLKTDIENGLYFFYEEEGQVLSTLATARPMVNGISVNMVYTPPTYRRKGYATRSVALLTRQLLDEGWKFTALFTDLDNPTSNSIYQKIGYRRVGESKHVQLRPRTS
jgi:uncharacterized protein